MKLAFILIDNILQLYLWVVVINAVIGWLVVFNIINTSNRFLHSLIEISYTLTEPPLRIIRKIIPIIGTIDFSPVVLILALLFLRNSIFELFAPYLFS
jgi:YggT family protein